MPAAILSLDLFLVAVVLVVLQSTPTISFAHGFQSKQGLAHSIIRRSTSSNQQLHLSSHAEASAKVSPPWTVDELEEYADKTGVVISFTTLGPGYRAVARAKHDESLILGYVEGFVRPAGNILHLDKMEVFKPVVEKAKKQQPDLFDFGGVSFGVGLMMGYRCLLFGEKNCFLFSFLFRRICHVSNFFQLPGQEKGCSVAEFLAIDDEEFQHKRLVRYYRRVGFQIIKYVGEDLKDVPDRLVWGGCGTLMREDIPVLVQKWANLMTLMKTRTFGDPDE